MMDRVRRVYLDTSVFGGPFDEDFRGPSDLLFEQIREGRFALVTSSLVEDEIGAAPVHVQDLFSEMVALGELLDPSHEALALRDAYLEAQIVTAKWAADALHVALATVAECSVLASWNFKHIVHVQKTAAYNSVNAANGHPSIAICTPPEVIEYDTEEDL